MKTDTNIPQSATTPSGRLPFLVKTDKDAEQDAVRRSVDAQFPAVAAFLAETAREHTEPLLTEAQRTLVMDEGLGAPRTAPVESAMRDIDDTLSPAENAELPLFDAQVVVLNWKPNGEIGPDGHFEPRGSVYGRFTKVWFNRGATTATLTPAQAREVVAEMRDFAGRLEALCERADEIAVDDHEARG
ncbi:hypothetical protein HLK59_29290 [Streptomyces sp. S3(2020)]|uniref:hypothetical protein n=1 Tax=Streptomyces sp. S3(2020) TaxID=2732044 RepID=UPI001487DFD2|nr:hypothetical protein [Streptomyces sp. S3(2020)]NNN34386.1 hypothetical protein [Streptomyces sp. S3(2020)]